MNKYKLSIAITIYNQVDILKWNLNNILKCHREDVQFLISDNCSTMDIESVLAEYNDDRIKYCRTEKNIGQDGNIINALEQADAKYVFLFRARDTVIIEKMDDIIEYLYSNPNLVYGRFSCLDENGNLRYQYPNRVFACPNETPRACYEVLVHPSGEVYRVDMLNKEDFSTIKKYLNDYFPENNGFLVDKILRDFLAQKGDFFLSDKIAWVYANSYKAKSVSAVATFNKISINSPIYRYPALRCEMDYIVKELEDVEKEKLLLYCIRRECGYITFDYKYVNKDPGQLQHYNCQPEDYSRRRERKKFMKFMRELVLNYNPKPLRKKIIRDAWCECYIYYWRRIVTLILKKIKLR